MMIHRSFIIFVVACAFAFSFKPHHAQAQRGKDFFFRDGDRAMILGDSITQQMMYSTFVESYTLSRFPRWNITFRNTGWGGDTMELRTRGGQEAGFARDIAPLTPTAVTIDFGMNDARSGDAGYDAYLKNARSLVDRFTAIGARVALVTSSPEEKYEANQPAGSAYNNMLRKYSEGLKGVAAEKNVLFIDQLNPMIATIEAGRAAGVLSPTASDKRLIPDAVHPGWAGHLVMAANILKGLNAAPLVSSVEIDAKSGKVNSAKASVTQIKTGDTLTFTRLDEALPWPMPNEVALALQLPDFKPLDDLSRYMLKVTHLTAPKYKLTVDDKDAGTYTREQLEAGVNLTNAPGPIKEQMDKLLKTIRDKNTMYFARWRQVQLDANPLPWWIPKDVVESYRGPELKKQDAQIAEAETTINSLRIPVAHNWSLTPTP